MRVRVYVCVRVYVHCACAVCERVSTCNRVSVDAYLFMCAFVRVSLSQVSELPLYYCT